MMRSRFAVFLMILAASVALVVAPAVAKAPAGRFVVDAKGETVQDTMTKLTWQRVVVGDQYNWAGAKDFCGSLPLAGGGWRLPDVRELRSIVDRQQLNPAIDPTAFPDTPSGFFWSSTPVQGSSSNAWGVHFSYGYSYSHDVTYGNRVRCVR